VKLLLATAESPLALALRRSGHQVLLAERGRSVAQAILQRPRAALVPLGAPRRIFALLAAAQVPYFVAVQLGEHRSLDPLLLRAARGVIAPTEALAHHAVHVLGAREASIVPDGLDLELLPLSSREAAIAALGLQPNLRILSLVARLEGLRLDRLAEAHRKLSGVALLVGGDGPQADFIQAMRAATRPSSPVIFLGQCTLEVEILALQAARLCWGPSADPRALALGRRQVVERPSDLDAIYPPELNAVRIAGEPLQPMLEAALEEEARAPLPPSAIERARQALGWDRSASLLAEVVVDALAR
jgi:hypothetical protein